MKRDFFKGSGQALLIASIAAILLIALVIFINRGSKHETSGGLELGEYYSETEREIANKVIMYLPEYLSEDTSAKIVNTAVNSYDVIMEADSVDTINEEHTAAMQRRIKTEILSYIDTDIQDDVLDDLSLGITEIILSAILEDLELPADKKDYEQEYYQLVTSLQMQIDAIKEKKMKVTIHANANNANAMDPDSLLSAINSMSAEELQLLEESLGIGDSTGNNGTNGKDGVNGENGKDGIDGRDGKDGRDGTNGKDGADGKDGNNGADGKTTYIAYADDANGTNFSLTPTETSKYVGTCITEQGSQPTDAKQYSNWQEYRSYVITSTTDDAGVTTVHIN